MNPVTMLADGLLQIRPAPLSSPRDFDFLEGKWNIRNRKLKTRLSNCTEWLEFDASGEMEIILNGIGNTDSFIAVVDGTAFEGRTLRLFNPQTKLWSIYWADSVNGRLDIPVTGSFDGAIGEFYCRDLFNEQSVLVKFRWDKSDPENPVWSQAFSADEGNSWEWNWYMHFSRAE